MSPNELASWVQAVGSILAILTGFGVVRWQDHQQRMREQLKQIGVLQSLWTVIYYARAELQFGHSNPNYRVDRASLQYTIRALKSVKLLEIPISTSIYPVLGAVIAFENVGHASRTDDPAVDLRGEMRNACAALCSAERALRKEIEKLGANIPNELMRINGQAIQPVEVSL